MPYYAMPIFLCSLRSTCSIGLYAMRYTLSALNWFADTLHCFHSFNQFTSLIEFTTILYAMLTKHHTQYTLNIDVYWSCIRETSWLWKWMRFCVIINLFYSTLGHYVTMIELFRIIFLTIHWLPSWYIHSILKFEIDAAALAADAFRVAYELRI